jgi:hypothetical protein
MMWDWPPRLYAEANAAVDDDYRPYGKPAGALMARHYRERTAS